MIGSFFSCICSPEFTGMICEIPLKQQPIGCLPDPCNSHGNCIPFLNGSFYLCICQFGYSGTYCEISPPTLATLLSTTTTAISSEDFISCHPNPCQFYGTCVSFVNGTFYLCICQIGYTGTYCEIHYGTTSTIPTTTSTTTPMTTTTTSTTITTTINTQIWSILSISTNECTPNPCFNNGICSLSISGKFSGCLCRSSEYTGYYCQNYNSCKK